MGLFKLCAYYYFIESTSPTKPRAIIGVFAATCMLVISAPGTCAYAVVPDVTGGFMSIPGHYSRLGESTVHRKCLSNYAGSSQPIH